MRQAQITGAVLAIAAVDPQPHAIPRTGRMVLLGKNPEQTGRLALSGETNGFAHFGHQRTRVTDHRRHGRGTQLVHEFEQSRRFDHFQLRIGTSNRQRKQAAIVAIGIEHNDSSFLNQEFALVI